MTTKRRWMKALPGRAQMRPLKRMVLRPPVARVLGRRKWEHKWQTRPGFVWQIDGVPTELAAAVSDRWLVPGMSVLDLGCGDGAIAAWLAGQGFEVHGVDFSETAVTKAKRDHGDVPGLTFDTADVTDPHALEGRSFDALIDRGCLHCLVDQLRPAYARNMAAWAAPGAPFLLTMIGADGVGSRRDHIEDLLGSAFAVEAVQPVEAMVRTETTTIDGTAIRLRRHR